MIENSAGLSGFADPMAIMGAIGKRRPPVGTPEDDLWQMMLKHLQGLGKGAVAPFSKTTGEAPSSSI